MSPDGAAWFEALVADRATGLLTLIDDPVDDLGAATKQYVDAAASAGLGDGDKGDITVASGGTVWTIDNDTVSDAKLRNSAALSVIGRAANSSGDPADIAAANDNEVLRRSGTTLGFGTVATGGLTDNAVTDAKLRDSAALSVIGRASNSSGDPTDIAAANDGEVLRRAGTAVGFGTVATAGIADDAVTYAKMQNVSATDRLLGRDTAGAGDPRSSPSAAGWSSPGPAASSARRSPAT